MVARYGLLEKQKCKEFSVGTNVFLLGTNVFAREEALDC